LNGNHNVPYAQALFHFEPSLTLLMTAPYFGMIIGYYINNNYSLNNMERMKRKIISMLIGLCLFLIMMGMQLMQ
jgi:hypothetical protein